jgi:ribonuclease HI
MDLNAYHKAWMQGLPERECIKVGEDAYEQSRYEQASYDSAMDALYDEWCDSHPGNPVNAQADTRRQ